MKQQNQDKPAEQQCYDQRDHPSRQAAEKGGEFLWRWRFQGRFFSLPLTGSRWNRSSAASIDKPRCDWTVYTLDEIVGEGFRSHEEFFPGPVCG